MKQRSFSPSSSSFISLCAALLLGAPSLANATPATMIPVPSSLSYAADSLPLGHGLVPQVEGPGSARVQQALARLDATWSRRLGGKSLTPGAGAPYLKLHYASNGPAIPVLGEDESYSLSVDASGVDIRAATDLGILRGLATLTQLPRATDQAWTLPCLRIQDSPRFAWRGLMLDVARHWMPLEVVLRNLDAMALVKLNVLHLHLSEDQGFRIESLTHPELHIQGSDGHYFTQEQIRTIIREAALRGIRVVPEFDIPGHATSWVVSHPELASLPGPYKIEREWGIFDPVLDPTKEATYALLADVLGEMCALFPDPYFHIGGDENNGVQWNANPDIQAFIREHQLVDNPGLHAHFNQRVAALLAKHGKKVMGWDEILHPKLPAQALIQSWRGPDGVREAAKAGHPVVLSNGYYIDLCYPASDHYLNDPLPEGNGLTPEQQALVLGGEATMWAEWVNPDTVDSRIWPRTAAIAERLWSPPTARDTASLYPRLDTVSDWFEAGGSLLRLPLERAVTELSGSALPEVREAVRCVLNTVEPIKRYRRGQAQPEGNQLAPLNTLADCVFPEARLARQFREAADSYLCGPDSDKGAALAALRGQLAQWRQASDLVLRSPSPALRARWELDRAARTLAELAALGQELLEAIEGGTTPGTAQVDKAKALLERAAKTNSSATEFRFLISLRRLLAVASAPTQFTSLSPEARRRLLEQRVPHDSDLP